MTHVSHSMMTSSNGNIFRVNGHLCGEFTGPGEFPTQRPVTRSFDVFFDLSLNKRLIKQSWDWWFETLSCSLWRHRNVKAPSKSLLSARDKTITFHFHSTKCFTPNLHVLCRQLHHDLNLNKNVFWRRNVKFVNWIFYINYNEMIGLLVQTLFLSFIRWLHVHPKSIYFKFLEPSESRLYHSQGVLYVGFTKHKL